MTSPTCQRYLPGSLPMIGAAHLVAMVATTPDHPCLPVIDQVVAGGGSADDVLAVLQQWSAWGLPPFCICERTPTGFRLLLRGDFEVRPDGEPPITVREEPWADGTVTNEAVTIRALMDPPQPAQAVPFFGGSALAGLVRFATGRAAELMMGGPQPASAPTPPDAPPPPVPVLPASAARAGLDPAAPEPAADETLLVPAGWALDAAAAEPSPATVWAVRCPAGHLTDAAAPLCRVCRAPVDPRDKIEVRRPVLGVLRLPDGGEVPLDGDVLVGRRPSSQAAPGAAPRLVTVEGQGGVSARHLEFVLDGWTVGVRDLGSTNGTVITRPFEPAQRLTAFELVAIEPGTRVTLAGEATVVFEADQA